jgi:ubiquinone/menaquinone biosynthesis C-methylase UbiE
MPPSKRIDPEYLKKQYKNSSNLDARVRLHQRFSVNKHGWHRWVFDHFDLPARCRILELGCGPAYLWLDNLDRLPPGWEILLSDFSLGMLEQARQNLKCRPAIHFEAFDAQSIPYGNETFDAVIANHMLYHVPDRSRAFSEIHRVLKPTGIFYATTVGQNHLSEMRDLICKFDVELAPWGRVTDSFTLENGKAQMSLRFRKTELFRYEDALEVTEVDPLVDYILSGWAAHRLEKRQEQFREFVARTIGSQGGVFHVTKDSGLFVSFI